MLILTINDFLFFREKKDYNEPYEFGNILFSMLELKGEEKN